MTFALLQEITFKAGEDIKYVVVALYDDEDPEPNEQLEIILASPKGGVTIGNSYKCESFTYQGPFLILVE